MDQHSLSRRDFLRLAGLGGVVLVAGSATRGAMAATGNDFYFVQLSDCHWGFEGPAINPDAKGTLKKAVAAVNSMSEQPDFIMFTGDLTHTTDDPKERRQRMGEFRDIVSALKVKDVRYMPGEHDASLDNGKAFKEFFGETHYTFDHKGVHFVVVDNVSDPNAAIGDEQLQWLSADLAKQPKDARIVVFTHRPLFDLYPQWDWVTRDGAKAITLLQTHDNVTVFYGHIHQEISLHDRQHRASLRQGADVRAAGGGVAAKASAHSMGRQCSIQRSWLPRRRSGSGAGEVRHHRIARGLGGGLMQAQRRILLQGAVAAALVGTMGSMLVLAQAKPRIIAITAKKFEYEPAELTLKLNELVVFQLKTLDVVMGFSVPDFGVRGTIIPGQVTEVPNDTDQDRRIHVSL